jgi:tRNA dimethylallyltransferase
LTSKPSILIILGPTATGKSSLAIELSKELNGEIISADSMQVYRKMDIGTAKPSREDLSSTPHHLIDIKEPDEPWTVSDFTEHAAKLISEIQKKDKLPIIAGGTGLYLNAFLEGFSFPITPADLKLRARLEKIADEKGSKSLWEKLKGADPRAAEKISENDKKRIIRALEVYETTGKPISDLQKKSSVRDKYNVVMIGLNIEREKLYERINKRVDDMISSGLVQEVKSLMEAGYDKKLNSMQALGYKEMIDHIEDKMGLPETVELIKRKTRNFARRQMTWFRRFDDVQWFDALTDQILTYIIRNV